MIRNFNDQFFRSMIELGVNSFKDLESNKHRYIEIKNNSAYNGMFEWIAFETPFLTTTAWNVVDDVIIKMEENVAHPTFYLKLESNNKLREIKYLAIGAFGSNVRLWNSREITKTDFEEVLQEYSKEMFHD